VDMIRGISRVSHEAQVIMATATQPATQAIEAAV